MNGSSPRGDLHGVLYLAYIRARQILYLKDASGRASTQNFAPPNILVASVEEGQRDGTLRTDLPARELAMYLSIMLKGFTAEWCEMNGGFNLNSALRRGFRIVLDGARLRPVEGADEKGTAGMTGGP